MKRHLLLLLLSFPLLFSCGKAIHIKTPDLFLDGTAQTKNIETTCCIFRLTVYEWSFDENGELKRNERANKDFGEHCKGDWFDVEIDKNNRYNAILTVSENKSGYTRKLTICAEDEGKGAAIHITQKSL